jgi:hypothetical protein
MKKVTRILVAASVLFMFACKKTDSTSGGTNSNNCATTPSFASTVNALVTTKCAGSSGCHGAGSTKGPGALTTYAQIYNARVACNSSISAGSMPKGSTLADADKTALLCWFAAGAPNN